VTRIFHLQNFAYCRWWKFERNCNSQFREKSKNRNSRSPLWTATWCLPRRRFCIDTEVCCMGAHPPFWSFELARVKPNYAQYMTQIGRLNLTASTFNQLGQYTSSPGRRGYPYTELTVFFPNGGSNHRQYSLRLPTKGWPGWVGPGGWLPSEIVYLPEGNHPSQY